MAAIERLSGQRYRQCLEKFFGEIKKALMAGGIIGMAIALWWRQPKAAPLRCGGI
jgi:hypothetical protein